MKRVALLALILLSGTALAGTRQPNIIFILADDLGYSDIGSYGQQLIRTPQIDRLAVEGMRFTRHYSGNAVCAPSRCVLMTGRHPGHAFIRDNREVKPEGQWPIPTDAVTIAKLLKARGYRTGAFGKWGLGGPGSTGDPLKQGFDRFYGYNCQRVAHNYYPAYLWDNDRRARLNNPDFSAHQVLPGNADPKDPRSYAAYSGTEYAPDLITEQALRFIRENRGGPFFLYYPTTVPHVALQVPQDSLSQYLGKWDDPPYTGENRYLPQFAPHAAYAAMVTRMDREVGRMAALVNELGLDRDTIFIFTSDNGPVGNHTGGSDSAFFKSAGQFRGLKGSLYEGGHRVPCIVRWSGRIAPGRTTDRVTGFEDWMPTLLELAGAQESVPKDIDGISFARALLGKVQEERPFLYREFPAYGGQQYARIGDWKGIRQNLLPRGEGSQPNLHIELYNLADDPFETRDLSAEYPDIVARIANLMRTQHTASRDFPFPALDQH